jgi:predicted nuclease of predicted toxin-antitoxin system
VKFLGDMGISARTIRWLRGQGYEALHLRDEGLQRAADEAVLEKARAEGRILLTMDLDFGYLLAVSRERLPSVILFRLEDESSEIVNARLADVLSQCAHDLEAGAMVSVSEAAIRVRRLPIPP